MGKIKELLVGFEDEALVEEVKKELAAGTDPQAILTECQEGMVEIGNLFSAGEMFVSDLMRSAVMFKAVGEEVLPHIQKSGAGASLGKVVLGTVKDDIHDIGKDIVHSMLAAAGFEVIDVGVDAAPEVFIKALQDSGAKVLGLSCLLASCYGSILATVEAVKAAGLRDSVKIIIGGGPIDENVVAYSGADTMGADAQATVNFCKEVYGA